jgi:hypothetical protein
MRPVESTSRNKYAIVARPVTLDNVEQKRPASLLCRVCVWNITEYSASCHNQRCVRVMCNYSLHYSSRSCVYMSMVWQIVSSP